VRRHCRHGARAAHRLDAQDAGHERVALLDCEAGHVERVTAGCSSAACWSWRPYTSCTYWIAVCAARRSSLSASPRRSAARTDGQSSSSAAADEPRSPP
jgi:hypothetical protein